MARKSRGVNVRNYRVVEGNVTIGMSWFGDVLVERLTELLIEELTPVFDKMVVRARQLCRVKSGTLRDSIQSSVVARHDKTAVLGFLEAGDDDAFYAHFIEFGPVKGKRKWLFKPYLRPAFNEYIGEARAAIDRAVARLSAE